MESRTRDTEGRSSEVVRFESSLRALDKPLYAERKSPDGSGMTTSGPVGLDIGTSHIVTALDMGDNITTVKQLNAFFTVPFSKFTRKLLIDKGILFFEHDNKLYIAGSSADSFANMFNTSTRRPIEEGMLNSREGDGILVIESLIRSLIRRPKQQGETVCFSVPGEPIDGVSTLVYHESVIKRFLETLGYHAISINEGFAVIMTEFAEDDFTGIGISMGGGMCNVCFSYMSVPVMSYSIRKGGDYIDFMAGESLGEPATRIKVIKERSLDLNASSTDKIMTALSIYYDDLINTLVKSLKDKLFASVDMPVIERPLSIVLSGGTVMPPGCKERFEAALSGVRLPFEIASVRVSRDPLNTTSKGALIMATSESL